MRLQHFPLSLSIWLNVSVIYSIELVVLSISRIKEWTNSLVNNCDKLSLRYYGE